MNESPVPAAARSDLEAWRAAADRNAFELDPHFQRLLRRVLGSEYATSEALLRTVAEQAGAALGALVQESNLDENLPTMRRHDALGRPVEEIAFHPSYHAVGRVFWSSGVLALLAEPGKEVLAGALAYLLDQHGEAGHACPVACTAGAIKLLQQLGTSEQRQRYLPRLLVNDYERRLHAAQFVTEVQGGSDVGVNACTATSETERPGWYRISGEKWFCSVADAGLFVVSARVEGAPAGTRGLGLFLVPRLMDGAPNGFRLRRLKTKLGTRSMATAEVEFDSALGEAIGPLNEGFKNLVGIVLDTSRVHNALAACGIMRRCWVEAQTFAAERAAFEHRIIEYPAVQEILARMKLRSMAGLTGTFRILSISDRIAAGHHDEALVAARRISVMINKYWTARAATRSARDGIEVLGGNGTVEDFSVLPRLYRDAIVVESWEGTHNTLCAQVLRDFATRGLQRPWLAQLQSEIEALVHSNLAEHASTARALHANISQRIDKLLAAEPEAASARIRHVVDRMCRLTDWVSLCAQAQWEAENGAAGATLDALALYRLRELEPVDPEDCPELAELQRRFAAEL